MVAGGTGEAKKREETGKRGEGGRKVSCGWRRSCPPRVVVKRQVGWVKKRERGGEERDSHGVAQQGAL